MPSVAVKLYSMFFKFLLKQRLQNRIQTLSDDSSVSSFGVTSRPEETTTASNPSFTDGVASKDIHIDPLTSLTIRIFLPESALNPPDPDSKNSTRPRNRGAGKIPSFNSDRNLGGNASRRNSYGPPDLGGAKEEPRRNSYAGGVNDVDRLNYKSSDGIYSGYSPSSSENCRKLPVMVQFHGGGWVSGSNDSVANDVFCRRIAKLCDVIVVAVGYRLAPENRYPAAFEDGMNVLNWLARQANLAECNKSLGSKRGGGSEFRKADVNRHIADKLGDEMVEPWLAAHADLSR